MRITEAQEAANEAQHALLEDLSEKSGSPRIEIQTREDKTPGGKCEKATLQRFTAQVRAPYTCPKTPVILNLKNEYVRHKYIAYSFKKISNIVSFDWDNAYHRAFASDFAIDFFEGPRDPKMHLLDNIYDLQNEVKPIPVSTNTFLMEYDKVEETKKKVV